MARFISVSGAKILRTFAALSASTAKRLMLYSMTGYGRAEKTVDGRQITVEVRSLNGKGFDVNTGRLPQTLRPFEIELRRMVSKALLRGTTDVTVVLKSEGAARPVIINTALAERYYQTISGLSKKLGLDQGNILATLLHMPEVIVSETELPGEEIWASVQEVAARALDQLKEHRRVEGAALEADLQLRIAAIEQGTAEIRPFEEGRLARVRERLQSALKDFGGGSSDPNRFEQELIYYIEKSDISEEKMRLGEHLRYFREVMGNEAPSKGKVLGFILQEIGREINTLGSKAGEAVIQKIVVGMKDELEKAKEQVLNVL